MITGIVIAFLIIILLLTFSRWMQEPEPFYDDEAHEDYRSWRDYKEE